MKEKLSSVGRLVLADHEFMGLLSPQEREELLQQARKQHLSEGQMLFQKGDPGDKLFIIVSGLVEIGVVREDGKQLIFNVLGRGEVFGEIALLDNGPRTADATAISTCDLLVIDKSEVIPFLEHHPETTARVISVLCQRIRWISQNLEDALGSDVPHRLARKLVNLCNAYGIESEDGSTSIQLKLAQQDLANMLGVTRESVNKYLNSWQDRGWVMIGRSHLTIRDFDRLRDIAEDAD